MAEEKAISEKLGSIKKPNLLGWIFFSCTACLPIANRLASVFFIFISNYLPKDTDLFLSIL
jgi:hypothetical protein